MHVVRYIRDFVHAYIGVFSLLLSDEMKRFLGGLPTVTEIAGFLTEAEEDCVVLDLISVLSRYCVVFEVVFLWCKTHFDLTCCCQLMCYKFYSFCMIFTVAKVSKILIILAVFYTKKLKII